MAGPILWGPADSSGNSVANNLENALGFSNGGGPRIIAPSSPVNPTITATFGNPGDIYIDKSIPLAFIKQDSGTTTNWLALSTNSNVAVYYSGYMGPSSTWSTTSTTFADPTNSGGNTLTQRIASGLTITAAGSSLPGITFTPSSSSAVYYISAVAQLLNSNSTDKVEIQLTDGTAVISTASSQNPGVVTSSAVFPVTIQGYYAPGTTSPVTVKIQLSTNAGTANIGFATNANSIEWSVTQIAAPSSAGVPPVAAEAYLSTNLLVGSGSTVVFDTIINDTNSAYSVSTGLYTVPTAGFYRCSFTGQASSGTVNIYLSVNALAKVYLNTITTSTFSGGSQTVKCNAGDTIAFIADSTATILGNNVVPYDTSFSIEQVGGSSSTGGTGLTAAEVAAYVTYGIY